MARPDRIVRTGALSRADAKAVRRGAHRLTRGIYLERAGDPHDLVNRCRAAIAVAAPGAIVCGPTALALTLPEMPHAIRALAAGPVHLAVPHGSTAGPRRAGIAIHRRMRMPRSWRPRGSGIPVAPPWDCWADTTVMLVGADPWRPGRPMDGAAPGTFRHPAKAAFLAAIQAADALMRREKPILQADRFASEVASLPRRPGVRTARDVFGWARPRTDSLPETHLRLVLAEGGLPEPAVNHAVAVEGGTKYLDLALPAALVAIEYHGRHHTTDPVQVAGDIRRRAALHAAGWITIDVLWEDILAPTQLIARVKAVVATRTLA